MAIIYSKLESTIGHTPLVRLVKREDGSVEETTLAPVVFVPLLSGTLD